MSAQANSQPIIVDCINRLIDGLWCHQVSNSKVAQAIQELQWLKADVAAGLAPLSFDWENWFFRHAHDINSAALIVEKAVAMADDLVPLLIAPKRLRATVHTFHLRLFVAGKSEPSLRALNNLRPICGKLGEACKWDVVDILENPAAGALEGVIATPTLVRLAPLPTRKLIGDLADINKTLLILGSQSSHHESKNTNLVQE